MLLDMNPLQRLQLRLLVAGPIGSIFKSELDILNIASKFWSFIAFFVGEYGRSFFNFFVGRVFHNSLFILSIKGCNLILSFLVHFIFAMPGLYRSSSMP